MPYLTQGGSEALTPVFGSYRRSIVMQSRGPSEPSVLLVSTPITFHNRNASGLSFGVGRWRFDLKNRFNPLIAYLPQNSDSKFIQRSVIFPGIRYCPAD